mgnify:CR=1 FL=1
MTQWDFALTGSWPAWLVLGLGCIAAVVSYFFYRRKQDLLTPRKFWLLSGLRALLILVAALFVLKPVIRMTRTELQSAQTAVLVDTSRSMSIEDAVGGSSRLDAARSFLASDKGGILGEIQTSQDVKLFAFDETSRNLSGKDELENLKAGGRATGLGQAMEEIADRMKSESLSGIVLLSDGVSTFGPSPARVAREVPVPFFSVAVGGKLSQRGEFIDLGIGDLPNTPELIVQNEAELSIPVKGIGLADYSAPRRTVELTLSRDGETITTSTVKLPPEDATRSVKLKYVPQETGVHRLTVSLPALPEEVVQENNERTFTARVVDPSFKVLMVEGSVRAEYRFLRRTLVSDPNADVTAMAKLRKDRFLLQGKDPGIDLSRGLPAREGDFEYFDVIIIGSIASKEFTSLQLEYLTSYVENGGSVLFMGGYSAFGDGGYGDTPAAELFPVEIGDKWTGQYEKNFELQLTARGRNHPVMEGCRTFFEDENTELILEGANRVGPPRAGGVVLAVNPETRVAGEPMPVIAVQRYGTGKVLAVSADTTWKWKFQVETKGRKTPYYRFWRQAIRWLAGRKKEAFRGKKLVRAWTNKARYGAEEQVNLKARVRNSEGEPVEDATVEATITSPALALESIKNEETARTQTVQLSTVPVSMGTYQAVFEPPASGVYRVTITATDTEAEIGQDRTDFVVGQAAREFDRVDIDELTLRSVAEHSGGSYYTLATARRIPEALQKRRRRITYRDEINLWNSPYFFLAFLAIAGAEWLLRRRFSLS